jgi:hypothetical protein
MIVAGIDMGGKEIKVLILKDGQVLATEKSPGGLIKRRCLRNSLRGRLGVPISQGRRLRDTLLIDGQSITLGSL